MDIVRRLRDFIENEARSCSMDFGCVTPQYVYRMWGGTVAIEEITKADSSGLNVPPVSLSNVPGISETNVPGSSL